MSKFAREKVIQGNQLTLPVERAICYSGYREGQSPQTENYPSYDEIREDLALMAGKWQYLRIYDCSEHALTLLAVISDHALNFKVMLGVDLRAEVSNSNCPWGGEYSDEVLALNKAINEQEISNMISLANQYPNIVFAASIGNEASVDWNDHMVPVTRLVEYATHVKSNIAQAVTFCENYIPWQDKLCPLVEVIDFISIHTYPVWEYRTIDTALSYTVQNYQDVRNTHPSKPIVITEAGWTTCSNGRGIEPWNASVQLQAQYCAQLHTWCTQTNVLTFMFEAFDEPWKGSDDANEPEKHWGFFYVDRTPKPAVLKLFEK